MKEFTLNNGLKIPMIGLGTSHPLHGKEPCPFRNKILQRISNMFFYRVQYLYFTLKFIVGFSNAIKSGYRLIDTSSSYGNEKYVKWAIKLSRVKRTELFITTRVSNQAQFTKQTKSALKKSLNLLGTEYIDLYMFHWPVPGYFADTWMEMEELYDEGLVKSIGVANCHRHHLEELLKTAKIVPALNQFEIHPLFSQKDLVSFCKSKGISVEAYTPIGRNHELLVKNETLIALSLKYNKSIPQIILRWHNQNNIITVPRSTNSERQIQNISIFDFELTKEEMDLIDNINMDLRLRFDPDNCDFTKL